VIVLFCILLSLLHDAPEAVQAPLGLPVTVDYDLPPDFSPAPLEEGEGFRVLEQHGDTVVIIPLRTDTISLPPMSGVAGDSQAVFPAPLLVVPRTMPDTSWTLPLFPAPVSMDIPPGLPEDYLENHCFWKQWGGPPAMNLIPVISAAALLAALFLIYFLRRRKSMKASTSMAASAAESPLDEVEALLKSSAFAEGRWPEYYRELEKLLRKTIEERFGISNDALTWAQIRRQLKGNKDGMRFMNDAEELVREIILQRYADWGGSRERARRFTQKLISLRKDWHGK